MGTAGLAYCMPYWTQTRDPWDIPKFLFLLMFHVHTNTCIIPGSTLKITVRTAKLTVFLTGPSIICFVRTYVTVKNITYRMIDSL